jgi:hypothetical protein
MLAFLGFFVLGGVITGLTVGWHLREEILSHKRTQALYAQAVIDSNYYSRMWEHTKATVSTLTQEREVYMKTIESLQHEAAALRLAGEIEFDLFTPKKMKKAKKGAKR